MIAFQIAEHNGLGTNRLAERPSHDSIAKAPPAVNAKLGFSMLPTRALRCQNRVMAGNLNIVKNDAVAPRTYHHGDLRTALIAAAMEIIEEVGPDAFSLRAAARRAGVSPAAPAHHFGDTRGLLTAIATIGFQEFGDELEAVAERDRRSTIKAQCHAYLRFALARPGLCRLMWRKEALDLHDPAHIAAARRAFVISDRVVRGDAAVMAAPDDPALAPTIACWSMVHGFVSLVLDGTFFGGHADRSDALATLLDATLKHMDIG